MREHHKKTIENLVNRFKDDKRFLALIIRGSIARGQEKEGSDVDVILVVTDDEFKRRQAWKNYYYYADDICDYPGGYVDGEIVDVQFLRDVAERGSEPARAAFKGAFVAYSRISGLDSIIEKIPVYQEHEQEEKIRSFYSQMRVLRWLIGEAEKQSDSYLLVRAATDLVLFGGRMILAHNKMLYPYHKLFVSELRNAPSKPDNIMELAENLLVRPCQDNADLFYDSILNCAKWELPPGGWWTGQFIEDSQWNWRKGRAPVQDW